MWKVTDVMFAGQPAPAERSPAYLDDLQSSIVDNHSMGRPNDLVQGTLDLLILNTISLEPKRPQPSSPTAASCTAVRVCKSPIQSWALPANVERFQPCTLKKVRTNTSSSSGAGSRAWAARRRGSAKESRPPAETTTHCEESVVVKKVRGVLVARSAMR